MTYLKKLLLSLCLVTTVAHAEDNFFFHKKWEVTCDNTRTCRTVGVTDTDAETPVFLLLTRQAGEGQQITADMKRTQNVNNDVRQELPKQAELYIDDQYAGPLHFNDEDKTRLTPHQTQSLLRAITGNVPVRVQSGKYASVISNSGSHAVLLKMDALQGRLGTTSAVTRRGTKTEVLPALPVPVIVRKPMHSLDVSKWSSVLDMAALKEEIQEDASDSCFFDSPEDGGIDATVVAQLTPDTLLVKATCNRLPGIPGTGFWRINTQPPYHPQEIMLTASGFDKGNLVTDYTERVYGDCSAHREWAWTGENFELTSEYDTGACILIHGDGAWQLPVFVSEVR